METGVFLVKKKKFLIKLTGIGEKNKKTATKHKKCTKKVNKFLIFH